jgi:hypothetical protein
MKSILKRHGLSYIDLAVVILGLLVVSKLYIGHAPFFRFWLDEEPLFKLKFLGEFETILDFLPGAHLPQEFFGHPGLHQFIALVVTTFLGKTSYVIAGMNLFFSFSCLFLLYKVAAFHLQDKYKAILLTLCFASLHQYIVLSFQFYQDIPALFFSLLGYFYFLKKRSYWSVFYLTISCLILESYIAFSLSIVLAELYRTRKLSEIKILLIPFLFLSAFFIAEYFSTGHFSNSVTAVKHFNNGDLGILRSWSDVVVAVKFLWPYYSFIFFLTTAVYGLCKLTKLKEKSKGKLKISFVILFTALQFIVFYIFINEGPIPRDLLIVHILLYIVIFASIGSIPKKIEKPLTYLVFSYILLSHYSLYYVLKKWEPVERNQLLDEISNEISLLKKDLIFPRADNAQRYLVHPFYGFAKKQHRDSFDYELINIWIDFGTLFCFHPGVKNCYRPSIKEDHQREIDRSFRLYKEKKLTTIDNKTLGYKIYLKKD